MEDRTAIELVSTGDSQIHIVPGEEHSLLACEGATISFDQTSPFRPVYVSELYNKLKERGWNKIDSRFIGKELDEHGVETGNIYGYKCFWPFSDTTSPMPDSDIPIIKTTTSSGSFPRTVRFGHFDPVPDFSNEMIEEIHDKFAELFGDIELDDMEILERYFYNTSKTAINILSDAKTLDVIKYDSDSYTNTVDLSGLPCYSLGDGFSGKVDVNVQYYKEGKTFSRNTTFSLFEIVSGEVRFIKFFEDINHDVELECINGVVRAIPINHAVVECIINKCTVTYGNINS